MFSSQDLKQQDNVTEYTSDHDDHDQELMQTNSTSILTERSGHTNDEAFACERLVKVDLVARRVLCELHVRNGIADFDHFGQ